MEWGGGGGGGGGGSPHSTAHVHADDIWGVPPAPIEEAYEVL